MKIAANINAGRIQAPGLLQMRPYSVIVAREDAMAMERNK
jgi:hypothetical protein